MPRETFDVASIRISQSGSPPRPLRLHPSGLDVSNATALDLIEFAFDLIERDIAGELPNWVNTTSFDVAARSASGPLTPRQVRAMARALLEERFRLDASFERVEGRVYAMVSARPGGVTGTMRRTTESTCEVDAPLTATERHVPTRVLSLSDRCGFTVVTSSGTLTGLIGTNVTMQELAAQLSRVGGFGLPVVDRTGLDGHFDMFIAPQPDMTAPTSETRFLIALREQAGVVLRAEQGSFDVLRIRRIELPSEN